MNFQMKVDGYFPKMADKPSLRDTIINVEQRFDGTGKPSFLCRYYMAQSWTHPTIKLAVEEVLSKYHGTEFVLTHMNNVIPT